MLNIYTHFYGVHNVCVCSCGAHPRFAHVRRVRTMQCSRAHARATTKPTPTTTTTTNNTHRRFGYKIYAYAYKWRAAASGYGGGGGARRVACAMRVYVRFCAGCEGARWLWARQRPMMGGGSTRVRRSGVRHFMQNTRTA